MCSAEFYEMKKLNSPYSIEEHRELLISVSWIVESLYALILYFALDLAHTCIARNHAWLGCQLDCSQCFFLSLSILIICADVVYFMAGLATHLPTAAERMAVSRSDVGSCWYFPMARASLAPTSPSSLCDKLYYELPACCNSFIANCLVV